ncbi:DUF4351 domain-containing protein [Clostridium vincentii]|uniref:DUF4351 domain-containing protein n=1 Tax=Clostridium vincentii TaxID=52704 RepID=A0A2T0BD03_9CLOT|nr:DUF4351 domain-containing protein [Clostridium vincentii]PRR81776.1 hypothetical protein CLVI_22650 [Clostridium vincentii]
MDYNKVEDAVFKRAMEVFKEGAAEFFDLDEKIIAPAETEIKNIDIKTNVMDYLFYTDSGDYLHFEFQTTDKKDDISRFLYYDASLYFKHKKKIRTVVVYSSDIKNTITYLNCGTINYNVEAFYMKSLDGDSKLDYIRHKVENDITLTEQDIMSLSFIPLMSSKKSKSEITLESIEVANNIKLAIEKNKCITLLYALFDKFGDEEAKKRFKEVVSMTDVGKMIYAEGMEDGMERGLEKGLERGIGKGKSELLIRQLTKKFDYVPAEYKKKIMELPEGIIEVIGTDIFDMKSLEEIRKYFK